jgi:putative glycerol-1-phosphate prenyltransferase
MIILWFGVQNNYPTNLFLYLYLPMSILNQISDKKNKKLAVLIDPDKSDKLYISKIIEYANKDFIDFLLVGGSLINQNIDEITSKLKEQTKKPVILFPGSILQITNNADAIFLLSLISGRNPDFLIGNHVISAQFLKKSNLEIIPTGYILIESGKTTSVEYISNTKPIPSDKIDIIISTALAGEMLGLKMIYLEAGSGAENNIGLQTIKRVKQNISIPLIVGGGINNPEKIKNILQAGADMIVVGTAFEKNPDLIPEFYNTIKHYLK